MASATRRPSLLDVPPVARVASLRSLGGRRGRVIEHINSQTSAATGSLRPRAGSVGSVSTVGSASANSVSSHGSSLRRQPQSWVFRGVRSSTLREGSGRERRDRRHKIDINFVRELASQLRWRNRNLLVLTQAFLPSFVSEALLRSVISKTDLELPLLQERSGCCLKVNCSGFVELTTQLEQKTNGAAMLSKCIHRFYTNAIDIVMAYRGDIVRFNANTMIVFFEAVEDTHNFHNACGSRSCKHTPQELACIRAAACCFELHKHLDHVDVGEGGGHLTLQIGVGAGSMRVLLVQGSPSTESDTCNKYTVSGPSLDQASLAETLAGTCETVFSPQAWQHVSKTVQEGEMVTEQPDFHRFLALDTSRHTYPMVRHAALQSAATDTALLGNHLRSGTVRQCLAVLMNFLPDTVLRQLGSGTLSNVNELRTLSIAFVYVKGLDRELKDGAMTVSAVIAELQRAAFAEEGFLHRFLLDDQGLLLQFVFGVPPLVHTDDPLRACRACVKMLRSTFKFHLTGHAGVATGTVFCGLVGSDRRHEYGIVGSAVQLAMGLSSAADASVLLVDSVTHQNCEVELDFEASQVVLPESPGQVFRMLMVPAEKELRRPSSMGQPRHSSRLGWPAELSVPEDQCHIDRTPCTPPMSHPPPWLANSGQEEKLAMQWERPMPTLWTHVCAERPPPALLPSLKEGVDDSDGLRFATRGDPSPWRMHVKVPLPWPARSTVCGGVSPLPNLRTWENLIEAERVADLCTQNGGDMLVIAGPYGCGKTELTEHLVTRAAKGPARMQPIFGAMEVRTGQGWAAICGVVRGALALLQPSGRIRSSWAFSELLRKEVASQWEEKALVMCGLLDPTSEALPHFWCDSEDELGVTSQPNDVFHRDEDVMPLVDIAMRLIDRLLKAGSIVVSLRISQGTSLLEVETSGFWLLARALGSLALEHAARAGRTTSLLVLVTCREPHIPLDIDSRHHILRIGPLTGEEVKRYIHLCLGVNEDAGDPQQHALRAAASISDFPSEPGVAEEEAVVPDGRPSVPEALLQWLRRIADLPRHLEEGLTRLRHAGVITIAGGRCAVNTNLKLLNTTDWIHTHMVGRIISQMEAMVPEMQHVLQIATVLPGPFSSLDLAAAVRVHLAWDTPNMMALYYCVKHLIACCELVAAGFLRRIDVARGSASKIDTGGSHEPEEVSVMPHWVVTSFLIEQTVVSSTALQGMRMQLKRAILLARAAESLRRTRRRGRNRAMHRPSDASFSSEATRSAKMLGSRMRGPRSMQRHNAPTDVNINTRFVGLPCSCIVTSTSSHYLDKMVSHTTSGADSEEISYESPNRFESNFKSQPRIFTTDWPLSRHIPWKLLHQCFILAILVVVLLYPDLWIILEGSPATLDGVMLLAMCLFAFEMVHCLLYDWNYTSRSLFTDLVLMVCILLDVSWAMGKPYTELALKRRDPGSVWRIIGLYIRFGACAVRLTFYIQSLAGLLRGGYEEVKNRRSLITSDADVESKTEDTGMLETISKSLSQAILSHLVGFTILMIVSVEVVDIFIPPKEDASMQSWVQLLSHEASINSSIVAPTLQGELRRFKEFYGGMGYGPYHICLGAIQSLTNFTCRDMLWQSPAGSDFTDPWRESFRLNVNSAIVQASFDFSGPAKHEALIRMMIISTTVFCMVFVALSLDYVANGLIVVPLARLMPTVRQIMVSLREKFPTLALVEHETEGEDIDEVAAFVEMVRRITLIVKAANTHTNDSQDTQMGSEWINGVASPKSTPKNSERPSRILTHITSDVPMNDVRRLQKLGVSYDLLDSWDYDVLALDKPQLTGVTGWLLLDCANPYLSLQPQVVAAFLDAMVEQYHDENPYHNWRHACDVLHGVFRSCSMNRVLEFATRVDVFALLVAAVSHDAGHPGLNNIFLVQTSHELALRYNDVSPLENMHCSTMFAVLASRPDANVFNVLSREQYREARQICIETILHTDNAKHFEMVKELQMFYHTNSHIFEQRGTWFLKPAEVELLQQTKNRRLCMAAMLHGADTSNPCKPWSICESWADLVLSEFFAQGDKEKEVGIPVQMLNNRDTVNKPGSQVAFIQFFIYPFNTALVKIFAPLWETTYNLHTNLQKWQAMRSAEEQEKTGPTIQGICDDLETVMRNAEKEASMLPGVSTSPAQTPSSLKLAKSLTWASEIRSYSPMRGANKHRTLHELGAEGPPRVVHENSSTSSMSELPKAGPSSKARVLLELERSPREPSLPNSVSHGDEASS